MTIDQQANFIRGEASSSIGSGDTTINVTDADTFPDPSGNEYNVVVWDGVGRPDEDPDVEIVRVTARDTGADTLTVTRAQESTSASSHPSGSALQLAATAKDFTDLEDTKAALAHDHTGGSESEVPTGGIANAAISAAKMGFSTGNEWAIGGVEGFGFMYSERSITSKEAIYPNGNDISGFIAVFNINQGEGALYHIVGNGGEYTAIIDQGPGSDFTTTEDNANTFNVYWDTGNSRFEVQNNVEDLVNWHILYLLTMNE